MNENSKAGDWCYFTQTLPSWYAGGTYMNFTGINNTQISIRTKTVETDQLGLGPGNTLIQYYNHSSLTNNIQKNSSLPMMGTTLIEIFVLQKTDKNDFKLQVTKCTNREIIDLVIDNSMIYLEICIWGFIAGGIFVFLKFMQWVCKGRPAWETNRFVQDEEQDLYSRVE